MQLYDRIRHRLKRQCSVIQKVTLGAYILVIVLNNNYHTVMRHCLSIIISKVDKNW